MRKTFVWAMMAALVVAGSAFAAGAGFEVRPNETFLTGSPTTTNNDDSCDIGVAPAATLLLPYFEVDIASAAGTGETTIFTITNVSQLPQVAHITLWTDWSYPVIDFNVFLTGYDVQSINLYDVIVRGEIAPPDGTGSGISPVGELSGEDGPDSNSDPDLYDNEFLDELDCLSAAPVDLNSVYTTRMQQAFTTGAFPPLGNLGACHNIGGRHTNAVGYVTVDVANQCSTSLPTDPGYFTTEINFDNVFIGDYQQINGDDDFAQGNPMVHIRAIPEGSDLVAPIVNFDRTFYGRYTAGSTVDRRQPLPSLFAARWIAGGGSGFETHFKIWREGITGATSTCNNTTAADPFAANAFLGVTELVRFDEEENPETFTPEEEVSPPIETDVAFPETGLFDVDDTDYFPENPTDEAVSGWVYMNLDEPATTPTGAPAGTASQNWVVVSMRAEDRYSVDFDAAWLGNGCTGAEDVSDEEDNPIGPADNATP